MRRTIISFFSFLYQKRTGRSPILKNFAKNFHTPWGADMFPGKRQNFICLNMGFLKKIFSPPGDMLKILIPPGVKNAFRKTLKFCPCLQGNFHFWQVFEACRNFEVFKTYIIVAKIDTILIGVYFQNCFEN